MTSQTPPPPSPPRLLALDFGERRIGVAMTDELGLFAHARPAVHVTAAQGAVDAVVALVEREGASEVVVGLPLGMDGTVTAQTQATQDFVRALRGRLRIPVSTWDERLSSVESERTRRGVAARRSGAVDSGAAAVVLQAVLDHRAAHPGRIGAAL